MNAGSRSWWKKCALALPCAALALAIGFCAGCESRRARRYHDHGKHADNERATLPPAEPPVPEPIPVAPPPPPEPVRPPPPPSRPRRAEPKDDRLGACGSGSGPRFNVHGVDDNDTLNVRAQPDPQSDVLGQLSPHATGVLSLGQRHHVGSATWHKVKCAAVVGWVNERFLSPSR